MERKTIEEAFRRRRDSIELTLKRRAYFIHKKKRWLELQAESQTKVDENWDKVRDRISGIKPRKMTISTTPGFASIMHNAMIEAMTSGVSVISVSRGSGKNIAREQWLSNKHDDDIETQAWVQHSGDLSFT